MEIINYTQTVESSVVELWNETCAFDPITVEKFRKQALLDDNFDASLCFVAKDSETVIGFVMATKRKFPYLERGLEESKGWVNVIFVKQSYRRKGIGASLIKKVETKLIALGVTEIILGAYSPNYFFAGLDPIHHSEAVQFFNAMGYKAGEEHYSMAMDLHGYVIPAHTNEKKQQAEAKGFVFVKFNYSYALELLEFLKDEFGGGWKRNALIAMQNETAEDVILIVLDPSHKICGFCMRMIDQNPMRFGPIGIAQRVRNEGLGGVLIDLQCYEMSKRGIYHMYFITTNEAGKRYYERHGLSVFRTFIEYKREINNVKN